MHQTSSAMNRTRTCVCCCGAVDAVAGLENVSRLDVPGRQADPYRGDDVVPECPYPVVTEPADRHQLGCHSVIPEAAGEKDPMLIGRGGELAPAILTRRLVTVSRASTGWIGGPNIRHARSSKLGYQLHPLNIQPSYGVFGPGSVDAGLGLQRLGLSGASSAIVRRTLYDGGLVGMASTLSQASRMRPSRTHRSDHCRDLCSGRRPAPSMRIGVVTTMT